MLDTVYTQTQDMINAAPTDDMIDQWNAAITAAFEGIGEDFSKGIERGTQSVQAVYNIVINAQDKIYDQVVREVEKAISSDLI